MTMREKLSFRNWRISRKLLVVMLAISLVPLLLAAWIISASSVSALTQQTQDNMARLGNSVALHISSVLSNSQGFLRIVANDPQVAAALISDATPGGQGDLNAAVSNIQLANDSIDTVGIYNATGTAMAHTDPGTVGRNVSARDFIKAALAGEAYTSSFRRDLVNDKPGISLSAPVEEDGAVIGAVAIHLDDKVIDDVFRETLNAETEGVASQARETINIYLVDPNGIVMSQSRGDDWLYRSLGGLSAATQAAIAGAKPLGGVCPNNAATYTPAEKEARLPEPIPAVQPLGDVVAQAFQSSKSGSVRYCHPSDPAAPFDAKQCDGAFHVAAFAPVANPAQLMGSGAAGQPGLSMIVVDLPEASFLGSVERQRLLGLAIAAVMAVLAVIGSLLVARTLSRPISTLATTAGEVEAERPFMPSQIADVTHQGDEVGHLARVFGRMIVALQARTAELRAIYDIGRKVSSSIELNETLASLATSLRGAIPYDAAEISLANAAQGKLVVYGFAAQGDGVQPVSSAVTTGVGNGGSAQELSGRTYPLPGRADAQPLGLIDKLLETREGLLIADMAAPSAAPPEEATLDRTWRRLAVPPRSYLGVPLQVGGKLIGAIELVGSHFDGNNLRVLESVASQAAVAIQNAQEVQTREAQLKNQIKELRIEIDEIKRSKQVGEIVETDYFRRLSTQARDLRAGRAKPTSELEEPDAGLGSGAKPEGG